MISLPPLDLASLVRVSREGGLAPIPALSAPRSIDLVACPPGVREEVCDAVRNAAPHAAQEGSHARGGDQRYFRIEVIYGDAALASIKFDVPEEQTPATLVKLWREYAPPGPGAGGDEK
ncbi:protealysin inhibitor emfourin [Achromobacter sp. Marseille-Q4962]|uniref:protealysin inhibitor emfourin n=1 Tax=Achromobacter sp. Marseille-Q4962 TaxID=2942202 RepID=UPI0020733021|nr:protealysin inhibitor emfourin [Achromobacter sp. Marseille-Q4962]